MSRVVRAVLVWVMVIAMPVQGMAASVMVFCGPSHARMLHEVAATAPGHHGHDDASPSRGAAERDDGAWLQPGSFSCSACAACCLALALPARFTPPEVTNPAQPVRAAPAVPVSSHPPDGLDRPPRTACA